MYGIDILLQLTLYFIRKDNPYTENDFKELKEYEKILKEQNISEYNRKNIENNVKEIYKNLSNKNSFFANIESFDSIIANAHFNNILFMAYYRFLSVLAFFFIFAYLGKNNISQYIHIFKKIEHNYKLYTDEIMLKPIMKNGDIKTFQRFDIVKIFNENDKNKKEIKNNIKLLEESKEAIKVTLNVNNKFYDDISPFSSLFNKNSFYSILADYFDNYLKETCCINYVLKQKEIYDNIFNQLEKMKEKKNWGEFHPLVYK